VNNIPRVVTLLHGSKWLKPNLQILTTESAEYSEETCQL